VFRERNTPLLLYKFGRLKSVVEVQLDLVKPLDERFFVVDGFLAELFLNRFVVFLCNIDSSYLII
jgi:hypothetical protein